MPRSRQSVAAELGAAMQAYQRITQAFDDEVGRHLDLNPADLRCLDWLTDRPRSPRELSEATGLSSAATTAMIDRLERKGFVARTRDDTDRRKVVVAMTEEGQQRTWEFYGPLVREGLPLLDRVPVAQLEAMVAHLTAIHDLTQRERDRLRATDRQPRGPVSSKTSRLPP